jgi:F0F1-type ATP synthase membrane subunit b/b'
LRTFFAIALFVVTLAFGQEAPSDAAGRSHAPSNERAQEAAHEEGGEAVMPHEIWWKWANLAVLVGALWFLVGKNVTSFFHSRTAEIQKGIRDAAQVRADAEARAAEIESKISNLSGEIERIRATSKAEIATEGARIQAETEAQLTKIQAQAEAEIASATKQARVELKAHAAQLALEIAENQIRQKLDPRLQEDLANGFVNDLRQEGSAGARSVQ